jgi:hypothetical protein
VPGPSVDQLQGHALVIQAVIVVQRGGASRRITAPEKTHDGHPTTHIDSAGYRTGGTPVDRSSSTLSAADLESSIGLERLALGLAGGLLLA